MPSACRELVEAAPEKGQLACASTALTVLAITGNRFKLGASAAFVQNVKMRAKAAYAKGAAVAHHRVLMRKHTKAEMSSNAPSTG